MLRTYRILNISVIWITGLFVADIGVVYLYRFAEGEAPARVFLDSYRAHPAGVEHNLHVILKGFPDQASRASARALFRAISVHFIELDDTGFDIGSYFAAAKAVADRRLLFFNTFSEILADDWLLYFDQALRTPGVGLVGATGSWQCHSSAYEFLIRRIWRRLSRPVTSLKEISFGSQKTGSGLDAHSDTEAVGISSEHEGRSLAQLGRALYHLARFDRYLMYLYECGRFPNPHIRTNAFMIERSRFIALRNVPFKRKIDAYKFESGRLSLTNQISRQGLKPVVIDRQGKVYDIPDWRSSSTFWTDEQPNLIVADNQTRDYSNGGIRRRRFLEHHAWIPPVRW